MEDRHIYLNLRKVSSNGLRWETHWSMGDHSAPTDHMTEIHRVLRWRVYCGLSDLILAFVRAGGVCDSTCTLNLGISAFRSTKRHAAALHTRDCRSLRHAQKLIGSQ